jgi:hypothetical protein
MIKTTIIDGEGTSKAAHVTPAGALLVETRQEATPSEGTENVTRYFSSILGAEGADSGITNQNVDGSATPQTFYIQSHADYDIHIMRIAIILADGNISHSKFGGVTALTNGWNLEFIESGDSIHMVQDAKTSGEVIAQTGFANPYGDSGTSFELTTWTGVDDAHTIVLPVSEYVPGGLRIGRGTQDKFVATVRDDLTGLTDFNVRLIGYRRYPF